MSVRNSLIQKVYETIASVIESLSLDDRTCFTALKTEAPEGRRIVFTCSEAPVMAEVRRCLSGRVDDDDNVKVHYVLLPEGESLPERFTVANSVADIRKTASHTAELITQVIDGEALTPLTTEGDWYLVRLEDGYLGWIRSWHLAATTKAALDAFRSRACHRVSANVITVYDRPNMDASPMGDAVIGTRLLAQPCGKRGWRRVEFADGRTGFLQSTHVEPVPRTRRIVRKRLAATGIQFMGIPYLWGGTTPKGFDCSGLVQRIFMLHGVAIPRDSDLQATFGRRKVVGSADELVTGDLLFFGKSERQITHVAMSLSDGLFLHAHGQVRVGALDPGHPFYDAALAASWRCTRDPLAD